MAQPYAMLSRIKSSAVLGIDAYQVDVEVDIANGLPSFATVGLPHGAVKEGRERVNAAIVNSGFEFPLKRITVNLAPADVRKEGSAFDLPVAMGILMATGQLTDDHGILDESVLVGELGLNGEIRPVRGGLCIAVGARTRGRKRVVLPRANVAEASVVEGIEVVAADSLRDVVQFVLTPGEPVPEGPNDSTTLVPMDSVDLSEVRGQAYAKRAMEVAAAGAHNILMTGPPGSGKTMLARRLPTILPPLTREEALETTKIHSVAGLLGVGAGLVGARPFRAPHHTISDAGLIGGGAHPRPGEVSVAHGGVLFLDELPEFRKNVLEVLRQPLEDGCVTISRAASSISFPSRFMLAAAMNPCPCGFSGDPRHSCNCPALTIEKYLGRISGPLLDRIDIQVQVPPVVHGELAGEGSGETSAEVRERVINARDRQLNRFADRAGVYANAHASPRDLRALCRITSEAEGLLQSAMERLHLSARAYHRVLKIGRTVADLAESEGVRADHVAEAIQYRNLDRRSAAAGV